MSPNPIQPLTAAETRSQEDETAREGYVHRVLVAFDIMANTICGGLPDETISSRSARAALDGRWWGVAMSEFLNFFQGDHGACAMAGDVERARRVMETEKQTKILQGEE